MHRWLPISLTWAFVRFKYFGHNFFQAADVLAYEMFKHVTNQIVGKGEKKVRISFNHLIRPQDDDYLEYWPQDRLEEYVESKTTQDLMKNLIAHNFGKRR